jgi:hypothetical protein
MGLTSDFKMASVLTNRPVVTFSSETRTLTAKDVNNQRIFERKIFGPVNMDNIWRKRNNMETGKLMEGADIVRFINL